MKVQVIILLTVFLISSCSQGNRADKNAPGLIDIESAFNNIKPVIVTDIAKDVEYVRLETSDDCIIGRNVKVYSDDQYLIAIDRTQILVFNRKTGKFVRKIGQLGNGPGEYNRTYTKIPFNEEDKVIYAGRYGKRYVYSIDGEMLQTETAPDFVSDFVNLDDNLFATFTDNYMGDEKKKIVIFNKEDTIVRIFPNYLSFQMGGQVNIYNPDSWFYRLKGQLTFCEMFNDTIFQVTSDNLIPRYVLFKGEYTMPYEIRGGTTFLGDKFFFSKNLLESSKYLFYAFTFNLKVYTAIYNKDTKEAIVNDFIGESGGGFIDNSNDFVPLEISSINQNGELICTIDAFKIRLWFDTNPDKTEQLPESLKSLNNITESENPVVAIARLKE